MARWWENEDSENEARVNAKRNELERMGYVADDDSRDTYRIPGSYAGGILISPNGETHREM